MLWERSTMTFLTPSVVAAQEMRQSAASWGWGPTDALPGRRV